MKQSQFIDWQSLVLAHMESTVRRNLDQLFTYQYFKRSIDQLAPEYKSLVEELCPAQISLTGIHGVFRSLLAEQVTIQPVARILEGIAEALSSSRRIDRIVEHVRLRIANHIVTPHLYDGKLKTVWINPTWEEKFQKGIRRDERSEIVEFQVDLRALLDKDVPDLCVLSKLEILKSPETVVVGVIP
jgi:flagellar biosynthesis protein FlhA